MITFGKINLGKHATVLLTGAAHVLTAHGPLRGPLVSWSELGLQRDWDVVVRGTEALSVIEWLGPRNASDRPGADTVIDLQGGLLLPGLIDAHTHAVFAGDRSGEFCRRMAGATYAEIAQQGGGIVETMRQTRAASIEELVASASARLEQMLANGVRVVEIKTGYGLDRASEVKLLATIGELQRLFAGRMLVVATAMPAHAVPPEFKQKPAAYVALVCDEILPAMAGGGGLCRFVDVFIEKGYFDVAAADKIWRAAQALGWQLKAHVDEFADIGGVAWAVGAGAVSVEHLLATTPASIALLAASETVAVVLPLTSLFLREPCAPMRALVDAGALVAIATDCNPGSAMSTNLPLALQIAMLNGRLSPQECLRAVTSVAAQALGCPAGYDGTLRRSGPFVATWLEVGHPDALFYELGAPPRARSFPSTD